MCGLSFSGLDAFGSLVLISATMVLAPPSSAEPQSTAIPVAPTSSIPATGPTIEPMAPAPTKSSVPPPSAAPEVSRSLPDAQMAALLPRDLSPWGMFLSAHIIVKLVMALLALASVATWTIALAKGMELLFAKRRLQKALRGLGHAPTLMEATASLKQRSPLAPSLAATALELQLSADIDGKEGIKERVASRLARIEAERGRRMIHGTGLLATIGATAPFVGLFGTVWGIMNSFIGISKQHTTSLAVVAPGIAEALLLATALGLFAAIPAVIIYNILSRSVAAYRALLADAGAEIMRLVSRDLDRQESRPSMPRARAGAAFSVTSRE